MQLLALEQGCARIFGDVWRVPGSGGVDYPWGSARAFVGFDAQPPVAVAHHDDLDRTVHREAEFTLVDTEILGHGAMGRYLHGTGVGNSLRKGKAGQVVYAVCRSKRERWPAVLPSATRLGRLVQHHEIAPRRKPQLLEMEGRRKAGLPRTDDGDARFVDQWGRRCHRV